MFGGSKGPGKAQPLDSLILTPFGFKRFGDIKPGDQVSNPDGTISRVIGVYPQGVHQVFRITSDDGAECRATGDHLWNIKVVGITRFQKRPILDRPTPWRMVTTSMMLSKLAEGKKVLIPLSRPCEFTVTSRNAEKRWPLDAYALGALLGDGCLSKDTPELISHETHQAFEIEKSGIVVSPRSDGKSFGLPKLRGVMKALGLDGAVSDTKFIPKPYIFAPLSLRWRLIQGLMDTDGFADKAGAASYSTSSRQLAKDVQKLAWSLGYKANITSKIPTYRYLGEKKTGKLSYTVWIKGNIQTDLFTLPRKKERCAAKPYNNGLGFRTRKIVKVVEDGDSECQCIAVDNPNGLYITDCYMVTHNTECLLIDSLRQVANGNYRALLLRRTYPRLGELIDRSHKYFLGAGAVFSGRDKILELPAWTFPSGAKIAFGHIQHEQDKYNYQGKEVHYLGFDQLEEFTESQYLFMIAQNRTGDPDLKCWVRSTGNPGGVGHGWVKRRFLDSMPPNQKHWFKKDCDEEIETKPYEKDAVSRCFIPATLFDNPTLLLSDPGYLARLRQLSESDQKAFILGDWEVFSGQFFNMWRKEIHVKEREVMPSYEKFISLDYGYSAPSCALWWMVDFDSNLHVYRELYMEKLTYTKLALMIKEFTPENEIINYCAADPAIWGDKVHHSNMEGESGYETMQKLFGTFTGLRKADHNRVTGWGRLRVLLTPHEGKSRITVSPNCKNLIRTLPSMVHDPFRSEDLNCFVAGTKISTNDGDKNIEDVKVGDFVDTPIGYKKVIRSGLSGYSSISEVCFSNGKSLRGTPNHKIFIDGKGLVELRDLLCYNIPKGRIMAWQKRLLYIRVLLTRAMRAEDIITQMEAIWPKGLLPSIVRSGWIATEKFLMGSASIILTMIQTITKFPIFSLSGAGIMQGFTTNKELILGESLRSGGAPEKGVWFYRKTQEKCARGPHSENFRAGIVDVLSGHSTKRKSIVQRIVKKSKASCFIGRIAGFAERNLDTRKTAQELLKRVHITAVGFSEKKEQVFNLTVEQAHLFYANGFLVTNTEGEDHAVDSMRYGVMSRPYAPIKGKIRSSDPALPMASELIEAEVKSNFKRWCGED